MLTVFSCKASPRTNFSVSLTIALSSCKLSSISSRAGPSSNSSTCKRSSVIGVLRSWLTAASMRVRPSTCRARRSCIRLNACVSSRASCGPRSGSGVIHSPRLTRSVASASDFTGCTTRRIKNITIRSTGMLVPGSA